MELPLNASFILISKVLAEKQTGQCWPAVVKGVLRKEMFRV